MNALQNLVNQPANAQFQQTVANKRNEIEAALKKAPSNNFSPAWRQTVSQIGGEELLGVALEERLRAIFEHNQITPSNALREIREIQQSLANFKNAIDQTVSGLGILRIGTEDLAPGEAEVGVEIPRAAVNNDLAGLEKELGELKFILTTFLEFSTGTSGPIPLRSISSTDLQFYFTAVPGAAAALAYAISLLVDAYKKIVDIRRSHAELKASGVPAEVLKSIEDYANNAIKEKIEDFVAAIESKHFRVKDSNRKNELEVALKISLTKLANRIDHGYHIEVRIAPTAPPGDAKGRKEYEEAVVTVSAAAPAMRYIRLEGDPILSLPEDRPKTDVDKKGGKKS